MEKYLITIRIEDKVLRKIASKDAMKLLRQTKVSINDSDTRCYTDPVGFDKVGTVASISEEDIQTLKSYDMLDDKVCDITIEGKGYIFDAFDDWDNIEKDAYLAEFEEWKDTDV